MTATACSGSVAPSSRRGSRARKPSTRLLCGVYVTQRQLDVLRAICDVRSREGWPPSRGEICEALGIKARSAVDSHVYDLEASGLVVRVPYQVRCLRITDLGAKVLEEAGR